MSEVFIDDVNLNKIANSIRRKNGLVRTYKPREMASAIRAFRDFIPSPHEYNVIVNQTPHQQITIRKFLETNRNNHTGTFTVAEPFYTLDVSIEPEFGYIAGQLNCGNPVVLDRDMIIEATPAIYDPDSNGVTTVFTNGSTYDGSYSSNWSLRLYSDSDCTHQIGKSSLGGKVRILFSDTGRVVPLFPIGGISFLGTPNNNGSDSVAYYVTEVSLPYLDTGEWNDMRYFAYNCNNLRNITGFENWNMSNVSTIEQAFRYCYNLRAINLSNWDVSSLIYAERLFHSCRSLKSLDLYNWNTNSLKYVNEMFVDCNALEYLDISNWNTSLLVQNLNLPPNLKYLVMDKEEIKFINVGKCNKPNNYIKYLVPSNMVNEYKVHADWQNKANNIFSVDDFNIVRYGGQVFVTPNE